MVAANELPPTYTDHPLVRQGRDEGFKVLPLALYLDGVSFQRKDSVLGVWVYSLVTRKRHLLSVLRRSEICNCGCKGWCSFEPIFQMIAWSLESMCHGCWPSERHDGSAFPDNDPCGRADRGGQHFGWRAAVVLLKGDWSELHHTLGLPSWSDTISPCPWCFVDKAQFSARMDCQL